MLIEEPPQPQRGRTAEERVVDAAEAEESVPDTRSITRKVVAAANPLFLLKLANDYPVVIKQFLWFCFILVYPAWLFVLLMLGPVWVVGKIGYGLLWLLFLPVRMYQKKHNPEEYAAYKAGQRDG